MPLAQWLRCDPHGNKALKCQTVKVIDLPGNEVVRAVALEHAEEGARV